MFCYLRRTPQVTPVTGTGREKANITAWLHSSWQGAEDPPLNFKLKPTWTRRNQIPSNYKDKATRPSAASDWSLQSFTARAWLGVGF